MVCEFVDQVDEVGHAGRESEVVEANEANIHNVRLALETATITVMRKSFIKESQELSYVRYVY